MFFLCFRGFLPFFYLETVKKQGFRICFGIFLVKYPTVKFFQGFNVNFFQCSLTA